MVNSVRVLFALCATLPLLAQDHSIRLNRVAEGLANPVDIQAARDGTNRLFFVQQDGLIRLFRNGALVQAPFLDIRSKTSPGGERGLLGMAFPPGYARKGYFYVHYTDLRGTSVVARYRLTSNPDAADPSSEQILLTQNQPFSNHNAGQLAFGPDGYLYVGFGDGGSGGDPQNNGQNPRTWLGKMLRIDTESDLARYRVPESNPFAGGAAALPEIWALGLRNPWRYSFDLETGDLYIADVGQNRAEEINFQPASSRGGENYGWRVMEGFSCLTPGCAPDPGLTAPIHEYPRSQGVSVTGGYVYRGARYPGLRGMYIYGDFGSGRVWGLRREGGAWVNRPLLESGLGISTFGQDDSGELYVADHSTGEIFSIEGTADTSAAPRYAAEGVVNAASNAPGLTPGSAATLYGAGIITTEGIRAAAGLPLPETLEGVEVLINGRRAPLYAVAKSGAQEQVNFQAPFEMPGAATATVIVRRNGVAGEPVPVPVAAAQPGVFTLDGREAIVVRSSDNSLVTAQRPLRAGDLAYFYATGLGAVTNSPATGAAAPREPLARAAVLPRVSLGGVDCEVIFAGLAPDLAGVYQVNIRVGAGIPRGSAPLVVTQGGASSPAVSVPLD